MSDKATVTDQVQMPVAHQAGLDVVPSSLADLKKAMSELKSATAANLKSSQSTIDAQDKNNPLQITGIEPENIKLSAGPNGSEKATMTFPDATATAYYAKDGNGKNSLEEAKVKFTSGPSKGESVDATYRNDNGTKDQETVTDAKKRSTTYTYDDNGYVSSESTNGPGAQVHFTSDSTGGFNATPPTETASTTQSGDSTKQTSDTGTKTAATDSATSVSSSDSSDSSDSSESDDADSDSSRHSKSGSGSNKASSGSSGSSDSGSGTPPSDFQTQTYNTMSSDGTTHSYNVNTVGLDPLEVQRDKEDGITESAPKPTVTQNY